MCLVAAALVLASVPAWAAALSPRRAARALARARRYADGDKEAKALAELDGLLATNPEFVDAHVLLIDVRSRSARAVVCREYEGKLAAAPERARLHFLAGYACDETPTKLRRYRKAVELDSKLYPAQLGLGRLCREESVDDLAVSRTALEAAAALRPKAPEPPFELARTLRALRRTEEAVAAYRKALELDDSMEAAWLELAALLREQSPAEARKALEEAVDECSRSGPLWWALADLQWVAEDYGRARSSLEQALRYGEDADYSARAKSRLACVYLMRGWHRSAQRLGSTRWDAAAAEMDDGRLPARAFRAFHAATGEAPAAVEGLEAASRLAPRSAVVRAALARAAFAAGRYAGAAVAYREALALRPGDHGLRRETAVALLMAGEPDAARTALGADPRSLERDDALLLADIDALKAGRVEPSAVAARHAAGEASGDPSEYRRLLRAAVASFPAYVAPRVELAAALRQAGRPIEARSALEAAPDSPGQPLAEAELHVQLGSLALADKSYAKAIDHFRQAIERSPECARYHGALARACVARGELGSALDALARQLALDPTSYDAPDSRPDRKAQAHSLQVRLAAGDVLRYRYSTDGGQPGRDFAVAEFDYVVDAVHPGELVEATLEVAEVGGRTVEGGAQFAGTRIPVTCSNCFGLVDVTEPDGGVPREFTHLLWLVQFIHGPALPVPRRPGQRWQEPGWTELGRLYGGGMHFESIRRGTARLSKAVKYEKPANEPAANYEIMAVAGQAAVAFDLERRLYQRVEITTDVTLTAEGGSKAELPPWQHRLELVSVRRGARKVGRRRLIEGVSYVRQVGPRCAAASLVMALRRFGRDADQEKLFDQLRGHQGGVHAHALPTVAARLGFEAHTYVGSLADLKRKIDAGLPVVLFLTPMGMGHAVVAVGYDDARREIILHDPATAPLRRVAYDRLEREWLESDHSCLVVFPKGAAQYAGLKFHGEEAIAATFEGSRCAVAGNLPGAQKAYRRALELRPGYVEARLSLARVLVAADRMADAHAELDRLVAQRPDCLTAKVVKADLLIHEKKLDQAIALLRAVNAQDPQNLRNLNVLATAYALTQQREKAVDVLEKAVRYAPGWVTVRFRLAALYVLDGRYDSAVEQYRVALDYEPRNTTALYLLAVTLYQSLNDDRRREAPWLERRASAERAIRSLESLRAIEGPSCETSGHLAHLSDYLGNGQRAVELLKRSVRELTLRQLRAQRDTPSDADPFSFVGRVSSALRSAVDKLGVFNEAAAERATNLNNLAWAYAIRGIQLQEARRLAEQSVALRAAGFNLDTLAWIDYQLGNLEAAREGFQRAIAIEPDPVLHLHLALTHQKLGDTKNADAEFKKAFTLERSAADVFLDMADACAQAGLGGRELEALEAAAKADARHRLAQYRLALGLLERATDLPRALAIATRLHAADRDDPLYCGLLGAACHLTGAARRARPLLERAIGDDPLAGPQPAAPFRYFLAVSLLAAGERARAAGELERYIALSPNGPLATRAAELLKEL